MRSKFKWIFTLLLAFTMQFSFAQEKTITGVVSDVNGPIPGANVVVKGTTKGVSTGFDGKYSIKAKEGDQLVISFMGMNDVVKTVGASNVLNVLLQDGSKTLETVVVTALNVKKRADATTTNNQIVRAKELTQASQPNIIQSLNGKVTGLQINNISNSVEGNTRIQLRGLRSIGGSNEALVVIDGAISSAALLSQLPPELVESVNVIKGAQGSALYGEQGANGVIIVTTKRGGKSDKLTVDITHATDFENILFLPERQTSYGQGWNTDPSFSFGGTDPRSNVGFVPWENGAWGPSFEDPAFVGTMVPVGLQQADGSFFMTPWKSRGQDNIKAFFQTGLLLQNGVTLNAGGEDGYALLNLKRETRDFMVPGDALKRSSFMLKAGKKIKNFSIDANVNYINQSSTQTSSNLFDDLLQAATNIPIDWFENSGHGHNWTVYADNPYTLTKQVRYDSRSNIFNGLVNLGYKFNKNISASVLANAQLRNGLSEMHDDGKFVGDTAYDFTAQGYDYGGNVTETYADLGGQASASEYYITQSTTRNFYNDWLLNFDYDLTESLNFKANIGLNIQDEYGAWTKQGGKNLDIFGLYNITNVKNRDLPSSFGVAADGHDDMINFNRTSRLRRLAQFAQVDFAWKDYLFLNATLRHEETSNVKGDFTYPSVGLSFVPTKAFESLKDNKVLNFVKISGNYTINGSTTAVRTYAINDVAVIPTGFPFGNLGGFRQNFSPTNPSAKPEQVTTKELNLGLGFFNDRITFEGSIYQADTKDLISATSTSTASGITGTTANIGSLQNKGFELELGLTPIKTDSFTWSMKGGYSTFKTKITSLAEGNTSVSLQQNNFIGIFAEVGEEFPLIKGTAYIKDPNGNVVVDSNGFPLRTSTFEKLGKSLPDYILNFSNTFTYKGISLTAVADFRTGHQIYSAQYSRLGVFGYDVESAYQDRNVGYVVPNSVQETSPGVYTANTTPVGGGGYANVLNYFSNRYSQTGEAQILDATALKIREIALSYTLPAKMLQGTGIQSVKFGVNARNPFVLFGDPFKGKSSYSNKGYTDPESSNTSTITSPNSAAVNALGISNVGQYPSSRTYGFSLNVTF